MIILYIIITILDLLRNDLSNQAVMMFCIYMIADRIVLLVEEKKKSYISIYFNVIFRKNTSNKMQLEELKKLKR